MDTTVPYCLACGYDLTGLTEPRCPECGVGFDVHQWRRTIEDCAVTTRKAVVAVMLAPLLVVVPFLFFLCFWAYSLEAGFKALLVTGPPLGFASIATAAVTSGSIATRLASTRQIRLRRPLGEKRRASFAIALTTVLLVLQGFLILAVVLGGSGVVVNFLG